jgi:alkylation response protein AidB-like acyl-CoA dehydrogenase
VDRTVFEPAQEVFRGQVRAFVAREVEPNLRRWEAQGHADRDFFPGAARAGLLGHEQMLAGDYRYNVVVSEELVSAGATAIAMAIGGFNDLVAPYLLRFGTPEQRARWLPALASGRSLAALAMTEPGAGSDLRGIGTVARRDGDHYVVHGQKALVGNAGLADVILLLVRTGDDDLSLLVVEGDPSGLGRGEPLEKIGLHAQQMGSLELDDVRVPAGNLLGLEGRAMDYLRTNLAQERLCVAVMAMASVERLLALTLEQLRGRTAFGRPLGTFQANTFALAELWTEATVGRAFVDRCIAAHTRGELTGEEAAMAKWWVTEMQQRVAARCLQLHGGGGYLRDSPVAREFLDARASTIYAGTTEIMKHIIGRHLLR